MVMKIGIGATIYTKMCTEQRLQIKADNIQLFDISCSWICAQYFLASQNSTVSRIPISSVGCKLELVESRPV